MKTHSIQSVRSGEGSAVEVVEAAGWPFAWGALRTLLVVAGAVEMWPEWEGDWTEEMGVI